MCLPDCKRLEKLLFLSGTVACVAVNFFNLEFATMASWVTVVTEDQGRTQIGFTKTRFRYHSFHKTKGTPRGLSVSYLISGDSCVAHPPSVSFFFFKGSSRLFRCAAPSLQGCMNFPSFAVVYYGLQARVLADVRCYLGKRQWDHGALSCCKPGRCRLEKERKKKKLHGTSGS